MNKRPGGLGRGLGALIPGASSISQQVDKAPAVEEDRQGVPDARDATASTPPPATATAPAAPAPGESAAISGNASPVPGARFVEIPLADIRPNPRQPRQVFEDEPLAELVASIREVGILQPVVVRPDANEYLLIMGERRLRAAGAAGLDRIPAIVRDTTDDDLLRDALLENLQRVQLNPLEEAAAYQQMLEDFGCTHEDLSRKLGRSRPQITNTIRLLKLPPAVQRRVAAGVLSAGHARALLALDDANAADRLAERIVAEGLSVRTVEEIVATGGATAPAPKAQRRAASTPTEFLAVADRLSERFDTRVRVSMRSSKGAVTIEFAGRDDLDRIVELLGG
jgi:ParB family chromosome partitioning protein